MSTIRQKKLAKAIVENAKADGKKNAGQLLESVGYPKSTATTYPGKVIKQVGVQEELEALGFNEDGAKRVVEEILYDRRVKPDTRINAAKEVFKVSGSYAPDKTINLNLDAELAQNERGLAEVLAELFS